MALASYPRCPICERPCELEVCVVDEKGRAVHKSCFHKPLSADVMAHNNYDEIVELLQQAHELREIANRLLERSDALIAAYKQLTGRDQRPRMDH